MAAATGRAGNGLNMDGPHYKGVLSPLRGRRVAALSGILLVLVSAAAGVVAMRDFLFEGRWIAALDSPSEIERAEAVEELLARHSKRALPKLLGPGTGDAADRLCEKLGPAAVPVLLEVIGNSPVAAGEESAQNRRYPERALGLLAELGPSAAAAERSLTELLENPEPVIRAKALDALSQLGIPSARLLPLLRHCLYDPDGSVRGMAAKSIRALGEEGAPALPELIQSLKRARNLEVLLALRDLGKPAAAAAGKLLGEPEEYLRFSAAWIIAEVGSEDQVAQLAALLDDQDGDVRGQAIRALKKKEPGARDPVAEVVPAAFEQDGAGEGRLAIERLAQIDPLPAAAIPLLEK